MARIFLCPCTTWEGGLIQKPRKVVGLLRIRFTLFDPGRAIATILRRPRQPTRLSTDRATSRSATVPSVAPRVDKRSERVWSTNLKLAWNVIDAMAILPKTWCSCRESGILVHALCMDICSSKEGSAPLSRSGPGSHFLPLGLCSLNPSVSKDARTGMLRLNPPFLSDSSTMGWPAAGKGATFGRAHLSPVMGSNGTQ
ncbi:hypothetical protein BKA56DRAFT_655219 [Ilyonectria sp. MPI-CAGE-AT-0026]|nr:hypothetical protein BKA56DRAFT_655219 [Ilyonectria sp. MPI-CAGE-AT-0026]